MIRKRTVQGRWQIAAATLGFCLCIAAQAAPPFQRLSRQLRAPRAAGPTDKDAQELLRRMLRAGNALALSGDQVTTILHNGHLVSSEQHILRNGSRAFRLNYLQPPGLAGEEIVDDGRLTYHYRPATNTLTVGPSSVGRLRNRVPQVMDQLRRGALSVQRLGQDTVAGHTCAVIQVASRDLADAPRRVFWVDPSNGAQLRIDQYDSTGRLVSSSYYANVVYGPAIGVGDFRPPETPKNARVAAPDTAGPALTLPQARAQAGFTLLQPAYLPTGFHFQSASVSDFRQKRLVALRYENGLNVISLFETTAPNAHPAPGQIKHPRRNVLVLVQNGVRAFLVGNLGPEDMERVIGSLR